jgi:hypothetical protein
MTDPLKRLLVAGFRRFLYEMPPYWSRDNIQKVIHNHQPSVRLDDPYIKKIINELVQEDVVYLIGEEEIYMLLTETFVRNHSTDFTQKVLLDEVAKIKALHHPLPHQP